LAKASKKYSEQRFEYAKTNEYLPKPVGNEVTGGETTKKPRFGKRKESSKKTQKVRSTKIDHPYETGD
jgi:hypothetical protein